MKNNNRTKKPLAVKFQNELLATLQARFEKNMSRHKKIDWVQVQEKLKQSPQKLWSLYEMNRTGGEPDVVGYDTKMGEFIFVDCSIETPVGRRSLCFDREGQLSRKENQPETNAVDMAMVMGTVILTEKEYRDLQKLGEFDLKTSSWIETPEAIRKLGGALFCDRRYDTVFVYHNGAQSYYAVRGFRSSLRV